MLRGLIISVLALGMLGADVGTIHMQQLKDATQNQTNDTLYVVNFWATWCKPCVAEMPYFRQADEKFKGQKVKVVFVSLNSPKELATVNKFVTDKNITQQVHVLDAGNPNVWINQVDTNWSGAIPATVMYKGGKKVLFREGEFTQAELDSIIKNKTQ